MTTSHSDESGGYVVEQFRQLKRAENWVTPVSITVAITISVACFFGLREMLGGSGAGSFVIPFLLAGGGGFLLAVMWHNQFKTTPLSSNPGKRGRLILYAFVQTVIGMAFSAWLVATSIGGSAAITAHENEYATMAQNALLVANQRVDRNKHFIDDVERKAAEYEAHSKNELEGGVVGGGGKGRGPIERALSATANQMHTIARQMQTALDAKNEHNAGAKKTLREMQRLIADSSLSNMERQHQFADLVGKFTDDLAFIESTDLPGFLSGLNAGVAYKTTTAEGDEALTKNRLSVERFGEELRNEAKQMEDVEEVRLPPFAPISAGNAVVAYGDQVFGAWAIAIGLDWMPFLILLTLITLHEDVRTPPTPEAPFGEKDAPMRRNPPGSPSDGNGVSAQLDNVAEFDPNRKKQS